MSGKRQHYIMRLLFNGFASRTQDENSFVWCFRKDRPPFDTNTLNVGLEKFFYGEPGEDSLDEFITKELETKHSTCVTRVRKDRQLSSAADEEILIDFVHSTVVRTANLRGVAQKGFDSILSELSPVVTDAEAARQWLLKERQKNSPFWDKLLTDYVRSKYGVLNGQQEKFLKRKEHKAFKPWLQHHAEQHLQRQAALHKAQLTPLFGQFGEMAKASHNNTLKKILQSSADNPTPRHNRYRQLRWRVHSLESGSLILGDVAVLQFERRSGKFSAAFDGIGGDVILLPLSHDRLIIGSAEDAERLPSLNEINRSSAELSLDFFVSSRNSEQERDYQSLIGRGTFQAPKLFDS